MSKKFKQVKTFNDKDHLKLLLDLNFGIETQEVTCVSLVKDQTNIKETETKATTQQKHRLHRVSSYINASKTIDALFNKMETNKDNLFTINIQKVENVSLTPDIKSQSVLKRGSQLWNKTRNLQKMVNAFLHPSVTKIDDNIIMTQTLKDSLLGENTSCNNSLIKTNPNHNYAIPLGAFILKPEVDKELIRVALKERVYKCIIEGTKEDNLITEEIDKLFNMNPEKNVFVTSSKHHLFNHLLPNGKTLLYVACQEGNLDIVKYFISKGVNPNIRSKYGNMEDCSLWVACRWDYYDIVNFLLTQGNLDNDDIKYAIHHEKLSKKMFQIMHNFYFLIKYKDEKEKGCLCF